MYGTFSRFKSSCFLSCWIRELILSLRSSSPSPSVILPFRSRIVTPPTTRSSISIAVSLLSRASSRHSSPTFRRPKRPASVLRDSEKCQIFSGLRLRMPRLRRRAGHPFPERFNHHVQNRYEDDVQERGQEHAPRDRRADRMPRFLAGARGEDQRQHAEDESQRGHQDRTKANASRLDRRIDD